MGLHQAEFLQVAGKRGLGDAQLLRGQAAAQLLLTGDALVRDQAKDLAVPKCFAHAHDGEASPLLSVFLYMRLHTHANGF